MESALSKRFEVFQYATGAETAAAPQWEGWGAADGDQAEAQEQGRAAGEAALRADFERRLAAESRNAFDAGRERGRAEGQQAEREAQSAGVAQAEHHRRHQAGQMIEALAAERDRYLQRVEQEVVGLALAVAARILRREAQMDPLLLSGAVRVALGQLSASTEVRLRVPPSELDLWTEAMALMPNLPLRPSVVAGEGMRLGDCLMETELGSVDLGIRSQLGEIERGFFDRAVGVRVPGRPSEDSRSSGPHAATAAEPAEPAEQRAS